MAAGTAVLSNFPLVQTAHAAPDDPIRIGLIGCGGRGTGAVVDALGAATDVKYPSAGYHTENISAGATLRNANVKVVALADVFPDRLNSCREQLRKLGIDILNEFCFTGFDSHQKLLAVPEINYVLLTTVLAGSRLGEVSRLGPPFAATVAWLAKQRPGMRFVAPMANATARTAFADCLEVHAPGVPVALVDGRAQQCMAASDAVLLASGTVTLEAALVKRPMVVAYRVAPLTNWLLRGLKLVKTEFFSQPNLLAGRALVPEHFQRDVRPDVLGPSVLRQLEREDLPQLLSAAAGMDYALTLQTNAVLLDTDFARMLSGLPTLRVDVSIYGAGPSTHDRFTGMDGSFAAARRGMGLLRV